MRVLQLVQRPYRRGAEVFAYDLTRRFEELGLAVKTVYLYGFHGERSLPLHEGDVCLDGRENHPFELFPKFDPGLVRKVLSEITRFSPDIVQVNGSRTIKYGAASKRFAGGRNHWKLIYRNIGIPSDWHHWWGSILIYRTVIMPQMDGVVGVSRYSLDNARALYNLEAPSTIILNGISPERLKPMTRREDLRRRHGVERDDIVLLSVGFLDEIKRPDRFIRVLALVRKRFPRVHGWIVGDGPQKEKAQDLAAELGIGENVQFFGSQDDVASYMQAADLFVMTSDTEGIPAVVLEAGFMGLPVIATRVGGLPECVREGETGILVAPGAENDMVDAIRKLAANPALRVAMGENGRRWIQDHQTIDHVADRYLNFYRKILGEPVPSAAQV